MDEAYSYQDYLDIDKSTNERIELIDGKYFYVKGFNVEDKMKINFLNEEFEIAEVFS